MKNIKTLVRVSLLIGLSIVLTRFLSIRISIGGVEGIRIGFGDYPLILTGIIFGPILGGIAGILSDIIGFILSPMGPYMPHFTLTSALKGIIPGFISYYIFKNKKGFIYLLLNFSLTKSIVSLLIIYFINQIFRLPLSILIPPRAISFFIEIPVYTIITLPLISRLEMLYLND